MCADFRAQPGSGDIVEATVEMGRRKGVCQEELATKLALFLAWQHLFRLPPNLSRITVEPSQAPYFRLPCRCVSLAASCLKSRLPIVKLSGYCVSNAVQ